MQTPKIAILIPTNTIVEPETLAAIDALDWPKDRLEVMVNVQEGKSKTGNRIVDLYTNCTANMNILRKKALKTDADFFLNLDSDIVLPPNALQEMVLQNRDVVGGWYKMIVGPRWVAGRWVGDNLFVNYEQPQAGLVEVDLVGHGCMLSKRHVLKKIKFEHGSDYFCTLATSGQVITLGACGVWGNRCAENNFRMFMCGNVVCGHKNRETGKIVRK